MGEANVVFRAACAADAEAAVPLIYSSGPAAFDYVFDTGRAGGAQAFLRFAFAQGGGEFGWRTHRVAVSEVGIIAAGAAFDGRSVPAFTISAALQIFKFYGPLRAWGVIARGLRTEAVISPPRPREYYLGHLGVRPDRRGTGIGTQLVQNLLQNIDSQRHRYAALDVAASNLRARALYERLGFTVTSLQPSSLRSARGRVEDHYRMIRLTMPP